MRGPLLVLLRCAVALAVASGAALHTSAQQSEAETRGAMTVARVFVKTDEGGEGSELAGRRQSVTDLSAAFASRKKAFVVVDNEAKADLIVEVVDRSVVTPKVVMGLSPRPGDPSSIAGMNGPVRTAVLRVRVLRQEYTPIFTNKNKPAESAPGWKSAAEDLAGQIEKWMKTHGRP
jgi:hypothetical protein